MTQSDKMDVAPAEMPAPATPWWVKLANALGVALFCIAMFAGLLWLYTRNNTFPINFHPDEPGKVQQVMYESRNYLHPQLMLEATTHYLKWRGLEPEDPQVVVVAGREVSAFFGAAAATMFALTAYLCAGWWGLVLGAICTGLCPPLLAYSHYMKEDAALLVGIAMAVLASRVVWITRRWWTRTPAWMFLGAACAVACSGKYAGAMAVALPVLLIFFAPRQKWYRPPIRLLLVLPAFLFALGLINHRTLSPAGVGVSDLMHVAANPDDWESLFDPGFLRGLQIEADHSTSQHHGITANQPNTYMIRSAIAQSWPAIALAALLFPVIVPLTWRQGWGWESVTLLFTGICTLVLSYSVILFPRYALPIVGMFHLLAAIGIARLVRGLAARPVLAGSMGTVTALALLATMGATCLNYTWQFGHDSRNSVLKWLAATLPQNARVYSDFYARLDHLQSVRPDIYVTSGFFLPDVIPDVDYIARTGGGFVVICDMAYNRYYEPSAFPAEGHGYRVERNKQFYTTLLEKHAPIWQHVPEKPIEAFTNPTIKVYWVKPSGR